MYRPQKNRIHLVYPVQASALSGAGVVAAVIAMALRIAGYSHWVMWQMTGLFENVGTIQDGITTLTKPRTITDAPHAQPLRVTKGAIAFESGAIKFAECGTLVGNQAFFALMRHKEGFFRIHYGDAPKSINIDAPTTFLLLEAMRLMDEEGA